MTGFIIRFAVAGALVAGLPYVTGRFGPRPAAILILAPIITICGLAAIALQQGSRAMASVALASATVLPLVLVFLLVTYACARAGLPGGLAIGGGLAAWAIAATLLLTVTSHQEPITTRASQGEHHAA